MVHHKQNVNQTQGQNADWTEQLVPRPVLMPKLKVEHIRCQNGLNVHLVNMPRAADFAIHAQIKVGLPQEGHQHGITHFVEHLLGSGGVYYKSGTSRSEATGKAQGADFLVTSSDRVMLGAYGLSSGAKFFCKSFADMWVAPKFRPSDVERERKAITQEIVDRGSEIPIQLGQALHGLVFQGSDYARAVPGTAETVAKITRDQLLEYRNRHMGPQNTHVVMCGAIPERMPEFIDWLGGRVFPKEQPYVSPTICTSSTPRMVGLVRPDQKELTHIGLAVPGFPSGHEYELAATILNIALVGGLHSRLMQSLRGKESLVYGVSGKHLAFYEAGIQKFIFNTGPDAVGAAMSAFKRTMDAVGQDGITQEEFQTAQRQFQGIYVRLLHNPSEVAGFLASSAASRSTPLTADFLTTNTRQVENMTLEKVNEAAKQLYGNAQWSVVLLGKHMASAEKAAQKVFNIS
jgi:predicted Zn-dependent peptidase